MALARLAHTSLANHTEDPAVQCGKCMLTTRCSAATLAFPQMVALQQHLPHPRKIILAVMVLKAGRDSASTFLMSCLQRPQVASKSMSSKQNMLHVSEITRSSMHTWITVRHSSHTTCSTT